MVINKMGRDAEWVGVLRGGGDLSGTVKCNPKSTASSSTTILMEIGNILYQGYHILLEMTVSKVGVDTMATKQLFASEASRREGRLSGRRGRRASERVREYMERGERKTHSPTAFVPYLFSPILEYDAMRRYYVAIFNAIILKGPSMGGVRRGHGGG